MFVVVDVYETIKTKCIKNENVINVGFTYNDGVSERWFNYALIEIDSDGRIKVDSYNFSKMDMNLKFNSVEEAKDFIEKRFVNQFKEV